AYQHWGEPDADGARAYRALTADDAARVAEILRGGPVRRLILLATGFAEGSIRALAEGFGTHRLELLGFFFAFGGDDLTDKPELGREMALAVDKLGARRLSLLTPAFDEGCE